MLSNIQNTDFIFLILSMVVMDVFFFFAKKSTFQGLYKIFFAKKIKKENKAGKTGSRISCTAF